MRTPAEWTEINDERDVCDRCGSGGAYCFDFCDCRTCPTEQDEDEALMDTWKAEIESLTLAELLDSFGPQRDHDEEPLADWERELMCALCGASGCDCLVEQS